ncbi:hypothetical protein Verru16b_01898 [Lacunisphaera limnophila]|uniref:Tetratricopeptide repeat protein n=1 Tax=Lacunisphaera limnophila TaxID=1838286 RepID=A0A1D8AVA8_9BACT|nr:BatD family protein [Lacunisphaera limnophila]AOS44829.1 hypothetical protein Verru16b_01898 [Lacunisphaera limnophila]
MRQSHHFILLVLFLVLPGSFFAQAVRWDPPGGQLGFNQVSQLSLIFEDCEPEDEPVLPTVDGLQFARPSQRSETSIVNFKMSRTFTYVYPVRPGKRAPVIIPAFDVKTDKGTLRVAAARYTVGDAPVGNSGLSITDVASASLETPKPSVWAGEVFPLTYNLDVVRRYFHSLGSNVTWDSTPALADDWTKPEPAEALIRGERHVVATQTTRAVIKQPGTYTLNPVSQMVNLMVGTTGFGLFTQPNVEQRQLDSKSLDLTVKALPLAPAGFTGAVGAFTFTSKVVPLNAAVGEPVTWTLELAGTGNWPDLTGLPSREVSNEFQVVQPKSKRVMKDGTLFEGSLTEDVVLVPTRPGNYVLPPVRFSYFDPRSGTYQTIASEPVTVTITAGSAPVTPPASSGAPVQFSLTPTTPATASPNLPPAVAPVPPENLPRDPLNQTATGFAPLALRPLVWLCLLSAVLCPLILWLTLAALRSRRLDPQRQRREARAALVIALKEINSSSLPAARYSLLRVWQAETAQLFAIPHAAPGTPLLLAAVTRAKPDAANAWVRLWSEADRTLHGRDATLPTDWPMRADAALQAVQVPGWNPFSLFAGRNLLPFLFSLFVLSALFAPSSAKAETATEAYKRGDFPAAAQAWQATVSTAPTDWAARHNLALALAQQDRWAEAAAHSTSAFLLNSRSDATRWNLNLGVQRSGLANPQLVELSRGEGRYKLTRAATPGEWQLALAGASLLLALALIVLLLQGYKMIGAWGKPSALTATLLAIVLAGTATFSLHTYGPLAQPGAVFVWQATTLRSIPTEVDTTQKTSPLSAGSIAVAGRTFLGWTQLTFPGGQSGWVRNEVLIALYR